jgi:hypothetical protein
VCTGVDAVAVVGQVTGMLNTESIAIGPGAADGPNTRTSGGACVVSTYTGLEPLVALALVVFSPSLSRTPSVENPPLVDQLNPSSPG